MMFRFLVFTGLMLSATFSSQVVAQTGADFQQWLDNFRREAGALGIRAETLDVALNGVQPIDRVLELDRRQPELVTTFLTYYTRLITEQRVNKGRELMTEHRDLLYQVEQRTGVPARFIVAFWGLETNFGANTGSFPTVAALATLAWDARRSDFFRSELIQALKILDAGHIAPEAMNGSWAGAMGQVQFMPSTFTSYAVDGDQDGRKDIWTSLPDAFASAGNFLREINWQIGEIWGREVKLPPGFNARLANLQERRSLDAWSKLGVLRADGGPLPDADMTGALVLPQGINGPAFLVYPNFEVILGWNNSSHYALAIGLLADQLIGLPGIVNGLDADSRPLTRDQAVQLQQRLNELGYDTGGADGVLGRRTRAAVRAWQAANGLPEDGYASVSLLEQLLPPAAASASGY